MLWKKEKMLITSNLSFSHSVFERLVLQTHKNEGMFGKVLNTLERRSFTEQQNFREVQIERNCRRQNKCDTKIESYFWKGRKLVGKGENAGYQHFLLFPQYFQKTSFTGWLKVGIVW